MDASIGSPRSKALLLIFILGIATVASIVLNVPILRQILGFLVLAFVPGAIFLSILKIGGLGPTERIILSMGLSLSCLIIFGLLINSIYPLFGYDTPLGERSLVISFSVILLGLCLVAYLRNRTFTFSNAIHLGMTTSEKISLIVPIFFPLLSIIGMYLMNRYDSNVMVIALLLLIPIYVAFVTLWRRKISSRIYPSVVLLISISILLSLALRSRHLVGIDTHLEYYIFQRTLQNGRWQILMNNAYEGCLSISILPTIFQSVLNVDPEYLFRIFYPLIFSISPLIIFIISKQFVRNHAAFLASLIFMSQAVFFDTTSEARSVVALLFFALAVMVLLHGGISKSNKRLLFVIFAFSCVVSHYTTSYIFLTLLLLTWVLVKVVTMVRSSRSRTEPDKGVSSYPRELAVTSDTKQPTLSTSVTGGEVLILFALVFIWQSQVSGAAFKGAVQFIGDSFKSMAAFFQVEARGQTAAAALGSNIGGKSIPQLLEFVFSWLTIAFITVGLLATLVRYIPRPASWNRGVRRLPQYLVRDFSGEFLTMSLIGFAVLAGSLAVPYIFSGFDVNRTYGQMMIFLSLFFVVGGAVFTKLVRFKYAYVLILVVLVPYFLCTTGIIYQAFGSPRSMILNSAGLQYDMLYVHDQETACAKWLAQHTTLSELSPVAADHYAGCRVISQAGISPSSVSQVAFQLDKPVSRGYIFLSYLNTVKGMYIYQGAAIEERSLTERQSLFEDKDELYCNSGSEILK